MSVSVTLRPLEPADSERLLEWRNRPDIARWMYSDHVITPPEHARWFAGALGDPRRRYWIIEMDAAPGGLANLYDIDRAAGRCAWAYYLADPATRGQGVGAFVEYWVIEQVFGAMGLHKLCCEVLIDNEPVWKLHESFGFRREAVYRDRVRKNGQPTDVLGLGLSATDWAERREASRERLRARGFTL